MEYNIEHNINPETIYKTRDEILKATRFADSKTEVKTEFEKPDFFSEMTSEDRIAFLLKAMKKAADNLEFETATALRDEIRAIKAELKNKRRRK